MTAGDVWGPVLRERSRDDFLMTGEEYRQSLRDGRQVIDAAGKRIDDVRSHPQLGPGIDLLADYYDAHFRPGSRELLTCVDEETGKRASVAWQVPRTREDLERKRAVNRFSTYHFAGAFGRPPDYSSCNPLGLLSLAPAIAGMDPAWARNVGRYLEWGRQNCVLEADIVADVQSDRRIPIAAKPGRLRFVEERSDGIVLFGAKPCNSLSPQAHIGSVLTLLSPQANPDSVLYCAVPLNAPGITMLCREPVTDPSSTEDHPIEAKGEEADAFMIFDHVFVPNEQVFCYKRMDLLPLYHEIGALCLWHIMVRLAHKAELLAGTAQLIANVLGTTGIPQVRDAISEITEYATTLMAFSIASEATAELKNGVLVPNERYVTAGRLHSIVHYPRVLQLIRDISGQGLISRFTAAQFDQAEIGERLEEFLPGTGCSARAKNKLFNFAWDLVSGRYSSRVALFENVNSTPPAAMRNRIYQSSYREPWTQTVTDMIGISLDAE